LAVRCTVPPTPQSSAPPSAVNVDHAAPTPGLHFGFWTGPTAGDFAGHTCLCMDLQRWHEIVGVVDGTALTYSVYVDGQLQHEAAIPRGISPGSPILDVGRLPDSTERYLLGDVDDIAVWNRALVADEVGLLFEHPVLPPSG
jgi:hypothetical protein